MDENQVPIEQVPIEIAYATPDRQVILELQVASGTSPRDAVLSSNIDEFFPEIDKQECDIGIFGKAIRADHALEPGDRIEIYRPLLADPKEVRKKRAAQGLRMKKGGGKEEESEEKQSAEKMAKEKKAEDKKVKE